jgi:hypothetical protein
MADQDGKHWLQALHGSHENPSPAEGAAELLRKYAAPHSRFYHKRHNRSRELETVVSWNGTHRAMMFRIALP